MTKGKGVCAGAAVAMLPLKNIHPKPIRCLHFILWLSICAIIQCVDEYDLSGLYASKMYDFFLFRIGNCFLSGRRPWQDPYQALCWWRNLRATARECEGLRCLLGAAHLLSCQWKPHGALHHDWCMSAGLSPIYYRCHSVLWICQSRQKGMTKWLNWLIAFERKSVMYWCNQAVKYIRFI